MRRESLDLAEFIREQGLEAEIAAPGVPMPTVDSAAAAMRVAPEQIFKSILFEAGDGRCVLVVASGNGRIDPSRMETLTGLSSLRLARPSVARRVTGFAPGGTPPVGHRERVPVIVDTRVAGQAWGYAGGGRPELLVKIKSADIIRLTDATVQDVIQNSQGP